MQLASYAVHCALGGVWVCGLGVTAQLLSSIICCVPLRLLNEHFAASPTCVEGWDTLCGSGAATHVTTVFAVHPCLASCCGGTCLCWTGRTTRRAHVDPCGCWFCRDAGQPQGHLAMMRQPGSRQVGAKVACVLCCVSPAPQASPHTRLDVNVIVVGVAAAAYVCVVRHGAIDAVPCCADLYTAYHTHASSPHTLWRMLWAASRLLLQCDTRGAFTAPGVWVPVAAALPMWP